VERQERQRRPPHRPALVFDRGLSQIEVDAVEQILMEKWGL
jgi:hypothetical protein